MAGVDGCKTADGAVRVMQRCNGAGGVSVIYGDVQSCQQEVSSCFALCRFPNSSEFQEGHTHTISSVQGLVGLACLT